MEGVHEGKIEEYLHRNGIMSMSADKKVFVSPRHRLIALSTLLDLHLCSITQR